MNVLALLPYLPYPLRFGGAIRCFHLVKALAVRHHVEVAAFGTPEGIPPFLKAIGPGLGGVHVVPFPLVNRYRRFGQAISLLSKRSYYSRSVSSGPMRRTVERLLEAKSFDAVQAEFYVMGKYSPIDGPLSILDSHNVEYDNLHRIWHRTEPGIRRYYYRRSEAQIRGEELRTCSLQDTVLCTSERDRAILDIEIPRVEKAVIPNGVDVGYFTPSSEAPDPHMIVFTGMMGYVPNNDGARYFLDEVFPRLLRRVPDAKIAIVGSDPPPDLLVRASSNVIVTGAVDDVRPYVRRAAVFVVPLRMGGGTRLKVLEALAMGKPVVSTSIGCEGIDVTNGETAFIENHPGEFAERIAQLMHDGRLQHRMISQGLDLVRERYDWSVIGASLRGVYDRLLTAGRARAAGTAGGGPRTELHSGKVMHERTSAPPR